MSPQATPAHGSLPAEGTEQPWGGPAAGRSSDTVQNLTVVVNGTPQTTSATTLQDWVLAQGVASEAVATAVNGQFVPRSQRAATALQTGDAILTFQPIVGG